MVLKTSERCSKQCLMWYQKTLKAVAFFSFTRSPLIFPQSLSPPHKVSRFEVFGFGPDRYRRRCEFWKQEYILGILTIIIYFWVTIHNSQF